MRVRLADLSVLLESEAEGVQEEWARLFAGWECAAEPEIALTLQQAGRLPPLPELPPVYADDRGIVDVYLEGREYLLHFHDGALVRLYQDRAEGVVLDTALGNGRLEDVTLTSLAPMLRARGYYLLHAFAATHDGEAVLICGSSGSGKTTSGASLLLGGWRYLANDAVLLQQRDGAVFALPTPGYLQVRPPTLFLLPALRHRRGYPHAATASYIFPAATVAEGGWGERVGDGQEERHDRERDSLIGHADGGGALHRVDRHQETGDRHRGRQRHADHAHGPVPYDLARCGEPALECEIQCPGEEQQAAFGPPAMGEQARHLDHGRQAERVI